MRKALLLAALVAGPVLAQVGAAPWDGQHEGMMILTMPQDMTVVATALGLPSGSTSFLTSFVVIPSDTTVNSVRVTVKYRDASGAQQTMGIDASSSPYTPNIFVAMFPVRIDQIMGTPRFEARHVAIKSTFGGSD